MVGLANCETMALMGQRSVGLLVRPRKRNFLQTCWMNFLPFVSRGGDLEGTLAYCVLAPYLMGTLGKSVCCGACGFAR